MRFPSSANTPAINMIFWFDRGEHVRSLTALRRPGYAETGGARTMEREGEGERKMERNIERGREGKMEREGNIGKNHNEADRIVSSERFISHPAYVHGNRKKITYSRVPSP